MSKTVSSNSGFFNWIHNQTTKHLFSGKRQVDQIKRNAFGRLIEYFKRRELKKLLTHTPEHLDDMGISLIHLKWALDLPLSINATLWMKEKRNSAKRAD